MKDLSDVNDPVFSTGTMGKGYALVPQGDSVISPVDGEVSVMFKTKHAIGLTSDKGLEVLIHIGIDTVRLDGKYFKSFVKQGEKIKVGEKLIEFDWKSISKEGLDPTVMVIITNSKDYSKIETIEEGDVTPKDKVLEVYK